MFSGQMVTFIRNLDMQPASQQTNSLFIQMSMEGSKQPTIWWVTLLFVKMTDTTDSHFKDLIF